MSKVLLYGVLLAFAVMTLFPLAWLVISSFKTLETRYTVERDGFYAREWIVAEHSGTHLDAPAHFVAGPDERIKSPWKT